VNYIGGDETERGAKSGTKNNIKVIASTTILQYSQCFSKYS
jgi:hypothetical protein